MIKNLTDAQLRYIIIHELKHKMYKHLVIWEPLMQQDAPLANRSMDYVINLEINEECSHDGFAVMPDGDYKGWVDDKFTGMTTLQVFNILIGEQGTPNPDEGNDTPSKDPNEGEGEGEGEGGGYPSTGAPVGNKGGGSGFDEHDWEGASELTDQEIKELEREIDQALRQGALAAGKDKTGSGSLDMNELLNPQIDWTEPLRHFWQKACSGNDYSTFNRPNRRYMHTDVYMPSGVSETVEEVLIACDTSGSCMNKAQLTRFLSEIAGICKVAKPDRLRVIYWGSRVVHEELYERDNIENVAKSTKPRSGGGTEVECVPAYCKEKGIAPDAVIVLTDGEFWGGWGDWDFANNKVLWCIQDNPRVMPPIGTVVHIKSENLV